MSETITGTPDAIASVTTMPNDSKREGNSKQCALVRTDGRSCRIREYSPAIASARKAIVDQLFPQLRAVRKAPLKGASPSRRGRDQIPFLRLQSRQKRS